MATQKDFDLVKQEVSRVVRLAADLGVIVTVTQTSVSPFSMGRLATKIAVRDDRVKEHTVEA